MKTIILTPTAKECIETVAKRRYWSLVEEYTKTEEIEEEKEAEIEMLRRFLEEEDMGQLRSEIENRVNKGESIQVILQLDEKNNLKVRILSQIRP